MPTYLLEVENHAYDNTLYNQFIIEAEDAQMVKYHYHRTQRKAGYSQVFDNYTHLLEAPTGGLTTEIESIRRVDEPEELETLENYLPEWPKV